jgi:hypothetical protein
LIYISWEKVQKLKSKFKFYPKCMKWVEWPETPELIPSSYSKTGGMGGKGGIILPYTKK